MYLSPMAKNDASKKNVAKTDENNQAHSLHLGIYQAADINLGTSHYTDGKGLIKKWWCRLGSVRKTTPSSNTPRRICNFNTWRCHASKLVYRACAYFQCAHPLLHYDTLGLDDKTGDDMF